MIVTAHQPLYMPWLGFFHKAILSDVICILDNVQFADGDFIHRNKIKAIHGSKWLTIAVNKKDHFNKKISQIEIVDQVWQEKHIETLRQSYSEAPFFENYMSDLEEIIGSSRYNYLIEIDMKLLAYLFGALKITTKIVLASDLSIQGKKSDFILSACGELKASAYISGQNGKDYLNIEDFESAGINIAMQKYNHPTYNQLHGDFLPNMSVIDLLFNEGPLSRDIIMRGNAGAWNELSLE